MSQSSDFETMNFVAASLFTPDPLTPAPSTPEPSTPAEARATRRDEDRLFRHFRGYTWSQRSRNTKSWVWEYGFDIEKDSERRWVCRLCIERNRPKPGNVVAIGTQNAERHLWDHQKIQDPSGKRSAPASRKKPSTGYQTKTKAFNLDLNAPREQAIANRLIKSFDRNVFQRLAAEWIVESNLSFREPENKRLRAIFEYLNPFVVSTDAHVGHDTVRKRAVAEFEKHKGKKGPVGKLHNLVVAIHRSDLLTTLLRSIQRLEFDASEDPRVRIRKPLNVVVDNETRWLSQLYMIRRTLKLRPYLETLVLKHKQEWGKDNTSKRPKRLKASAIMPAICRDENKLGDKDWAVLEAFGDILQSFEDAVKALEGDRIQRKRKQGYFESYGNVWDVIVGYEFLLAELEKAKAMVNQYPEPEHFKVNINLGWKTFDEYYNKLDETPIYYTSLALHPAYCWGYFETVWSGRPAWISKAKDVVQSVWDRGYKTLEISTEDNGEPAAKRQRTQYYSLLSDIRTKLGYVLAKKWTLITQKTRRMVTPLRNQLEASTIAICQVLRSWLQAGIVEEVDPMLLDKVDDTMGEDSVEEKSVSEWLKDLPMQMREEETGWE
ncbi:hypothetical protein ACJA88_014770 [Fusarium oxysporum]